MSKRSVDLTESMRPNVGVISNKIKTIGWQIAIIGECMEEQSNQKTKEKKQKVGRFEYWVESKLVLFLSLLKKV